MPDKKIFSIRLHVRGKNMMIPVIRMIFPNGSIFYKIVQNRPVWLVSVNNKWKLTGDNAAGKPLMKKVVTLLQALSAKRSILRIEK
jgi:ABC-type molybdenum transport system ATPase subunit/photorepair protein PhrA